jgi:quinol monooxygenase YgiN
MPEHAAIIDVSRYHPSPGRREDLLAAMRTLATRAASREGCFGAQACESDQDGEALVAISRWESEGAMEAFANSPDFIREREQLTSLLARPATREHFRPR